MVMVALQTSTHCMFNASKAYALGAALGVINSTFGAVVFNM